MAEKTKKTAAPVNACVFMQQLEPEPVKFADNPSAAEAGEFRIVGYSGEIIPNHWYWGNLAFDLQGMTFVKGKTPVLAEHWTEKRLGFASKQEIADKVTFEGKFLPNKNAQEIKADMQAGFPMEASLYVPPSIVEQVAEGASVMVNGKVLQGPGAVFRKSVVKEVSICVFGADCNTSAQAFVDGKKEIQFNYLQGVQNMPEQEAKPITTPTLTAETFASQHPDIFKTVTESAVKAADEKSKKLFADFSDRFKADSAFIIEQFSAGKSIEEAKDAFIVKLSAVKTAPAAPAAVVDPAKAEFSDSQAGETVTPAANTKEAFEAEYKKDAKLATEFGNVEAYVAFKMADANGQVRLKSQT